MADGTKIEWCDATVNAVNGCSVISPGCTNCYAMRAGGRSLPGHPSTGLTVATKAGHVWTGNVSLNEKALLKPLSWRRPRRIFWNAHGDLFHDAVPDAWIDQVFAVCALTPQHTHMILTKRSARMRSYLTARWPHMGCDMNVSNRIASVARDMDSKAWHAIGRILPGWPLPIPNVWLGVSVEDQARADERIPNLLETPAAVRFLSCEPLLGPVNLNHVKFYDRFTEWGGREAGWESTLNGTRFDMWADDDEDPNTPGFPKLDWVIVGGESGPGARLMHEDWARSLRDQCADAGVPFFFKQWGDWAPHPTGQPVTIRQYHNSIRYIDRDTGQQKRNPNRTSDQTMRRIGKKQAGRLLDGVEHSEFPNVTERGR